ncbi:hypothetical protein [Streptomyces sp. NBC_01207]|uniref:hypothetical protein n=1 Tax=Streptomyces sp. NBC_01207 TaxID=2903772 RepID=UPI002E105322
MDPVTGLPASLIEDVRRAAGVGPLAEDDEVQHELLQAQIEVATPVCTTLDDVGVSVAAAPCGRLGRRGERSRPVSCAVEMCAAHGVSVVAVTGEARPDGHLVPAGRSR